ncbi:metal-binding protein [Halosegnis rubeus]|jgi:hypothetical protein|uniref:Metal-binding protein n=1 Tax=Halosegnis rubeus TaxID=2212850 RepID=A0A5N5U1V7_9EURY|nr:UPF0058 family protein [Halosegnis rubeus]KAB7512497.1 metal-binding protein [Halosegnis rubeus]KAB7512756.1 metal-binding protein [Halosegnis rubeus]KAB7514075.1 metal-binding protein [Halosegnis rubeus]
MKKQELIHLHGLLAEVRTHYEELSNTTIEHDDYASLGVRPTSIHKSKTDHKQAVFALADELTDGMEDEQTQQPTPAAAD